MLFVNKREFWPFFLGLAAGLTTASCGGSTADGLFSASGGTSNGGTSAGGTSTGGTSTGGTSAGGTSSGGTSAGGTSTGGAGGGTANEWTHCDDVSECTLITTNCCGVCGTPRFSDLMAIRWDKTDDYRDLHCNPHPPCPDCPSAQNTAYPAMCRGGDCVAVDPRNDYPSTRCDRDEDCVVRWGGLCCEPCSAWSAEPIAVNRDYQQSVCGDNYACPECETPPPPQPAFCVEGQCWLASVGGGDGGGGP